MATGARRHKAWCEIAISSFDPAHSVHAGFDNRQPHDPSFETIELHAVASDAAGWMRKTASARLSSGCAVMMESEARADVDLMHMLQVHLDFKNPNRKAVSFRPAS